MPAAKAIRSSLSSLSPTPSLSQSIIKGPVPVIVRSMVPSSSPIQSTSVVVADKIGPVKSEIATTILSIQLLSSVTVI